MDGPDTSGFQQWFADHGGWYHPHLRFGYDGITGLSLFAHQDIPEGSRVVEMPRELALTPHLCRTKILSAFSSSSSKEPRFEKGGDWVVFFLFLARSLANTTQSGSASTSTSTSTRSNSLPLFTHQPYVDLLPRTILTPTTYSQEEISLLRETPIHGDAIERRTKYRNSLFEAMTWLKKVVEEEEDSSSGNGNGDGTSAGQSSRIPDDIVCRAASLVAKAQEESTFEQWVWAHAAYSSRAFPPVMVSSPEEEVPRHLVGPVLLPGMDAFNHARGVPVTWTYPFLATPTSDLASSSSPSSSSSSNQTTYKQPTNRPKRGVGLEIGYKVSAGEQVFNCYGGKSNEEFLCGYGFVLPQGLDDQLTLVLGGRSEHQPTLDALDDDVVQAEHVDGEVEEEEEQEQGTALALRKPWGSKHYWRIIDRPSSGNSGVPAGLLLELRERLIQADYDDSLATKEEGRGLGQEGTSTPAPPPPVELSWLLKRYFATPPSPPVTTPSERLEALRLDGEILESLEELLCAKRKKFKIVQKEVDSLDAQEQELPSGVRREVFEMIKIYRRGQVVIMNQAIDWIRGEMGTLADLIEKCEDLMEQEEEQEGQD